MWPFVSPFHLSLTGILLCKQFLVTVAADHAGKGLGPLLHACAVTSRRNLLP